MFSIDLLDLQTDNSDPKPTRPYQVKDVQPGEMGKIVVGVKSAIGLI